jgi:hypothetical protein
MTPFNERAEQMGLDVSLANQGLFSYSDRYGEVVYRQLTTMTGIEDHPTNAQTVPKLAIFTKGPDADEYEHAGYVSELYKFIGNDVLNERIREGIRSVGMPILTENIIPNSQFTKLRNEIIIQSSQEVANVGDVLPVMIVNNSYDGEKAAKVSFGIATNYSNDRIIFGFSLGEMRQIHIASSTTSMSSVVTSYMQVFSENIIDMITQSFNSQLTENEMLATLDVIEGLGKKRREEVSKLLQEMMPDVVEGQPVPLPTAWQVFLAIVRYSSFEQNLNVKRLMENAAEAVLVIPPRMYEVLEQLSVSE